MLRAILKPMLLSATALASSRRGTISPTAACHAGPLNADPQPIRKVNSKSSQGVISCAQATSASSSETTSMNTCAPSMTRRRSRLSAIAPAISDSSITGSAIDACTSATRSADCAIDSISHEAPTD